MSKQLPATCDNAYMNIQITSRQNGETRVYLNGELFEKFTSGSGVLPKSTICIGDLRLNRGLQYIGAIYNFALYAVPIDEDANGNIDTAPILQNWNYTKSQLGI